MMTMSIRLAVIAGSLQDASSSSRRALKGIWIVVKVKYMVLQNRVMEHLTQDRNQNFKSNRNSKMTNNNTKKKMSLTIRTISKAMNSMTIPTMVTTNWWMGQKPMRPWFINSRDSNTSWCIQDLQPRSQFLTPHTIKIRMPTRIAQSNNSSCSNSIYSSNHIPKINTMVQVQTLPQPAQLHLQLCQWTSSLHRCSISNNSKSNNS